MTKREYAEKNIGMTFDFVKQIIEHPEILDTMPDGAEVDFIRLEVTKRREGGVGYGGHC